MKTIFKSKLKTETYHLYFKNGQDLLEYHDSNIIFLIALFDNTKFNNDNKLKYLSIL